MEGWRAGLMGVGIVLIGAGGYSSLDGVWKGFSLVAAGIALVLLGLSVERKPKAAAATPDEIATEASADDLHVTVPMAAVAADVVEPTAPLEPAGTGSEEGGSTELEPAAVASAAEVSEAEASGDAGVEPPAEAIAEEPSSEAPAGADDETAHAHDQPMLGHSELVSHIRDYHEGVPFDGSTIQLRLLHERAHA